jgi:general secretion pathway protein G
MSHSNCTFGAAKRAGFTLIELLVVLAIIAVLVTLSLPRYFHSVERSKEAVLVADLNSLREAIDKFDGDKGHYPEALDDLVQQGYLRKIPVDPITESAATWTTDAHPDGTTPGIYNVHSGADGKELDGTEYKEL